jgi:hypothetical protein
MALMLFASAWTLHFWKTWAFWLLFSALSAVVTLYFLKHDPSLVESRLKVGPTAAHEKSQKIIQTLTATRFRRDSHEASLAGSLTGN